MHKLIRPLENLKLDRVEQTKIGIVRNNALIDFFIFKYNH